MTALTRRTAHRGQHVTVTRRDGTAVTGTLIAWGARVIRLTDQAGAWREFALAGVAAVHDPARVAHFTTGYGAWCRFDGPASAWPKPPTGARYSAVEASVTCPACLARIAAVAASPSA